jgi:hypothetical protein
MHLLSHQVKGGGYAVSFNNPSPHRLLLFEALFHAQFILMVTKIVIGTHRGSPEKSATPSSHSYLLHGITQLSLTPGALTRYVFI